MEPATAGIVVHTCLMSRVELRIPYTEKEEATRPEGVADGGHEQCSSTPRSPHRRATDWFLAASKNIAEILKELT